MESLSKTTSLAQIQAADKKKALVPGQNLDRPKTDTQAQSPIQAPANGKSNSPPEAHSHSSTQTQIQAPAEPPPSQATTITWVKVVTEFQEVDEVIFIIIFPNTVVRNSGCIQKHKTKHKTPAFHNQ